MLITGSITWKKTKNKLSRGVYCQVASMITGKMDKELKCCDFVTDRLVNEPVHSLQKVINELIDPKVKKAFTKHLLLLQNFLKYQYPEHARKNDNVSMTCLRLCLFFIFCF